MSEHLKNDLGMETTVSDGAFFFRKVREKLSGLCATYVDDSLQAGDDFYSKLSEKTLSKFECREREWDHVQFAGVQIETKDKEFVIHQKRYISKLKKMERNADFKAFRSLRARLSGITHTRPDIACAVAQAHK